MKLRILAIVALIAFALLAGPAVAQLPPCGCVGYGWGIGGVGFGGLAGCNIGSLGWPMCAGGPWGCPWVLGGGITF